MRFCFAVGIHSADSFWGTALGRGLRCYMWTGKLREAFLGGLWLVASPQCRAAGQRVAAGLLFRESVSL